MVRDAAAEIGGEFAEDIAERSRQGTHVRLDRKAQAMGVTGSGIGVLAEQDDADAVGRSEFEGAEDGFAGREDGLPGGRFRIEKGIEFPKPG